MALNKKINETLELLEKMYPNATVELDFNTPFQLLVATVLSAQTTDVNVNKVTPELFHKYPTPEKLANANLDDVKRIIFRTGFFNNKAKSIVELSQQLIANHDGVVPNTIFELTKLSGVGRKTANVVLGDAFNIPGLTMDTHFQRISKRLGWVTQKNTPVETPENMEKTLQKKLPKQNWTKISHEVITHGRRICHARKPACGVCAINRFCPSSYIGLDDPELAAKIIKSDEKEKNHLLEVWTETLNE